MKEATKTCTGAKKGRTSCMQVNPQPLSQFNHKGKRPSCRSCDTLKARDKYHGLGEGQTFKGISHIIFAEWKEHDNTRLQ